MKEFSFKINGAEYKCAVEELDGKTNVTVNGKVYEVETEAPAKPAVKPVAAPAPKPAAAPVEASQEKGEKTFDPVCAAIIRSLPTKRAQYPYLQNLAQKSN